MNSADAWPPNSASDFYNTGQPVCSQNKDMAGARYFNPYRFVAVLFVFYNLGHTLGAVAATPKFGPASDAVVSAMMSVHVVAQGADCTWYGFFRGMGATVSVFFLFSTVLTWHLGGLSRPERRALAPVTIALFLSMAGSTVLAWVYFFPVPLVFSFLITILIGIGCVQDRKGESGSSRAL